MALATPELELPVRAPPTPAPPPLTAPPPAPPLPLPLPLPAIAPPSPTLSAHVYFAPSPPSPLVSPLALHQPARLQGSTPHARGGDARQPLRHVEPPLSARSLAEPPTSRFRPLLPTFALYALAPAADICSLPATP